MRGIIGRDGAGHTNTIPTFMIGIVGLHNQGVRATATAEVAGGNAVECIKPWVVADKWVDNSGTGSNASGWDQEDGWNAGVDTYTSPGFKATGTGNDYGLELALKEGATGTWSLGWTMEIDLGSNGSDATAMKSRAVRPGCLPLEHVQSRLSHAARNQTRIPRKVALE